MGVPKNVQEAADKADAIIDAAAAAEVKPVEQVTTLPPEANGKPAEPAKPAVAPVAEAPQAPGLQEQLEKERQLRRTIEGRLRTQLGPANEEVRTLRKELAELKESIEQAEKADQLPGVERLLSEEERSELGEDVIDLNSRMMEGKLAEMLEGDGIKNIVAELLQKSAQANQEAAPVGQSDDFWPLVDQYCPGARALNQSGDPALIEFLDLFDAVTGQRNRDVAEAAIEADDPIALAELFAGFMRSNGIVHDETATTSPTAKPERGGREMPVPTPGADTVESWTQAEVNAFYTDVSKGKFKGRQAEFDKLEAEIMTAAAAGKIV